MRNNSCYRVSFSYTMLTGMGDIQWHLIGASVAKEGGFSQKLSTNKLFNATSLS